MAGLVAAYELARAGHDPLLLEARQRVGGRVYTMREPFAPGLYAEAGAMRIPLAHKLTLACIERFGSTSSRSRRATPTRTCHLFGKRCGSPSSRRTRTCSGSELAEHDRGLTSGARWEALLKPFAQRIEKDGDAAWSAIVAQYDGYSTREFLEEQGWSEAAIELFGLVCNQEALMNACFLELLREEVGRYYTDMVRIDGGADQLPNAYLPALRDRIRFGARMIALDQSRPASPCTTRPPPAARTCRATTRSSRFPYPVLRHVEVLKPFSHAKRRAIRSCATTLGEDLLPVPAPVLGGRRRHRRRGHGHRPADPQPLLPRRGQATGRGVLLASYTWSEDAQRWGSLPPDERIAQALENVAQIHPQVVDCFEVGASWMWHDDPYAGGAFALFEPSQQGLLHEHIIAPEGRVHFAGEHASLAHAWIQGAIESGCARRARSTTVRTDHNQE
jgi:monoamine oxidase